VNKRDATKLRNTEHIANVVAQTEKHIRFRINKKWGSEFAGGTLQQKCNVSQLQ